MALWLDCRESKASVRIESSYELNINMKEKDTPPLLTSFTRPSGRRHFVPSLSR